MTEAMAVVLMGVTGSGKTTVGEILAERLGWPYLDGDDFHPPANVAKMAAGSPLTDEDRWPWLRTLAEEIGSCVDGGGSCFLGCSALKEEYRTALRAARDGSQVRFVHLAGDESLIGVLVSSGLCGSRGDARRTITGGGVSVNGVRQPGDATVLPADSVVGGRFVLLQKGRRGRHLLVVD